MSKIEEKEHTTPPIIKSLGKQKRKRIKQLKKGEGKLLAEVNSCIEYAKSSLPDGTPENTLIVPVVLIVEKKGRCSSGILKSLLK